MALAGIRERPRPGTLGIVPAASRRLIVEVETPSLSAASFTLSGLSSAGETRIRSAIRSASCCICSSVKWMVIVIASLLWVGC